MSENTAAFTAETTTTTTTETTTGPSSGKYSVATKTAIGLGALVAVAALGYAALRLFGGAANSSVVETVTEAAADVAA